MDYPYLAGLLDGEGTSTITWTLNKRSGFFRPLPIIQMGLKKDNREMALVESLVDEFGGYKWCAKTGRGLTNVVWSVSTKEELKKILHGIIPYLKLRREEACLLLDALEVIEQDKEATLKGFRKETILKLAEITKRLRDFNRDRRKPRIWSYDAIKEYVEKSPLYSDEYRLKRKDYFLESGKKTRFKKGRKLPESVEKKRLERLKEARKGNVKYPDEVVKEARRLYEEGYKMSVIATILNINNATLYDWIKRGARRWI